MFSYKLYDSIRILVIVYVSANGLNLLYAHEGCGPLVYVNLDCSFYLMLRKNCTGIPLDFVGGGVLKNQVVINQVKNPFFTGMIEQKGTTSIRGEVSGWEFDLIDRFNILFSAQISLSQDFFNIPLQSAFFLLAQWMKT